MFERELLTRLLAPMFAAVGCDKALKAAHDDALAIRWLRMTTQSHSVPDDFGLSGHQPTGPDSPIIIDGGAWRRNHILFHMTPACPVTNRLVQIPPP